MTKTTATHYELSGRVTELETGVGVPGVIVLAFDKDHLLDDRLGRALTDPEGNYHLSYDRARFRDLFEAAPDLYVTVTTSAGRVLHTTEGATRFDAAASEVIDVKLASPTLRSAGIETTGAVRSIDEQRLAALPCLDRAAADDELAAQIRADLERCGTVLALMKHYMGELVGNKDNDAPPGQVYYATKPLVPWSPDTDPAAYEYKLFEYFILMDNEWQARRLRLGFDLDNV